MMNHHDQQQQHRNPMGDMARLVGKKVSNNIKRRAMRLGKQFFQKIILSGIKAVLVKTAPIWGSFLAILIIAFIAYSLIFVVPKMIAEDATATATDRVAAFFGFSERDAEGYEDIFETYEEVANQWDAGLTAEQREQVQMYRFSWGILAGVDRLRNDPYIKAAGGGGHYIYFDGTNVTVDGLFPPEEYMPLYKAAEKKYGVHWNVLASIHFHETRYSQGSMISSAGAKGPFQFMPCTVVGWSYPGCSGYGALPIDRFDVKTVKKYGGHGVDGDGDGIVDIWNPIDMAFSAANMLSKNGYSRNIASAVFTYNHADWYVNMVLRDAEVIYQLYNEKVKNGEVEEVTEFDFSDIKTFTFFDLNNADKMITPKPHETFEALRPKFDWKDSTITTTWEEKVCTTEVDEEGNEYEECEWVSMKTEEEVVLLTQAHTYEGTYTHHYKWITKPGINGPNERNKQIRFETNAGITPPSEEEYLQPLYEVLEGYGIYQEMDVELTLMLIELFDEDFSREKKLRDVFIDSNFNLIEGANEWVWPSVSRFITSHYGPRYRPCQGCSTYHHGLDIGGAVGSPIFAMASGKVESAYYNSCGGNMIKIQHGGGIASRYLHLDTMSVRAGQEVTKGQVIGTLGNTGSCTTGPHLHWEIHVNGQTTDPLKFFK